MSSETEKSRNQEEEFQKLLDGKINTEDFIFAIEQHSEIWDASSEPYSNELEKINAWNYTICRFLPDFEQQSLANRNNISSEVINLCIILEKVT